MIRMITIRIKRRLAQLIGALFVSALIMTGISMPAHASGGQSVTIESTSYSEGSASAAVSAETRASINGAVQVTWQNPNHGIKIKKSELRKAPRFKIVATGANSSKAIYKKAKGATIVVLKKGSKVRNTGMYNQRRVGFVWTLKHDAVLVLDKKSRQYRHAFDIIKGKLVKTCLNYIGGNVPMYPNVVQVRYGSDIQMDVTVKANASGTATASGSLQCASGTISGSASASGSASGSVTIRVKVRNRVKAINAARVTLLNKVKATAKNDAQAKAKAKVTLSCNDTPTTPETEKPGVSAQAQSCVEVGKNDGTITGTATNPNKEGDTVVISVGNQSTTKIIAAGSSVSFSFSGFAPGTYTVNVFLKNVNKSATTQVTVNACPKPAGPQLLEIDTINDVLVNNSREISIMGSTASGHTGTLVCSAGTGVITANKTQTVQGNFTTKITYKAGDEAGTDLVSCKLTQDDGQFAVITTNRFEVRQRPVTP